MSLKLSETRGGQLPSPLRRHGQRSGLLLKGGFLPALLDPWAYPPTPLRCAPLPELARLANR